MSKPSLITKWAYFPQTYMLTKCLGHKNLKLFFRLASKSICGILSWATNA